MDDKDTKINGVLFSDIMDAMELLQKAGLDTTSVTMSLVSVMPVTKQNNITDYDDYKLRVGCWREKY